MTSLSAAQPASTPAGSARPRRHDTLAARNTRLRAGDMIDGARPPVRRAPTARASIRISRCPIRNGCACSTRSTGSPRTKRPISPIDGSAARRCAAPARVRMNGREVLACWEAAEPVMTIEPLRNLAGHSRSGRRPDAVREQRSRASSRGWSGRAPYPRFPEPLYSQADEGCLEGARLHRLHVLLLGLPGHRPRRSHRLRRPGSSGSARTDRARSAQRSGEGQALAGANRHLQLRLLLQMRGGLPRRASRSSAASSSRSRPRPRELLPGMARHSLRAARHRRRARTGRSRRADSARAGLARARQLRRASSGCCCAARSIRSRHSS